MGLREQSFFENAFTQKESEPVKKLSIVAITLVLLLSCVPSAQAQSEPVSDITVIYVEKYSCPYCREWKLWEWPEFKKQPEAKHVDMIMIDKGQSRSALGKSDYPKKYRYLYEQVSGFGTPVPAWLLIANGKPVVMSAGQSSWSSHIMPEIKRLVALKLAALAAVENKKIADTSAR